MYPARSRFDGGVGSPSASDFASPVTTARTVSSLQHGGMGAGMDASMLSDRPGSERQSPGRRPMPKTWGRPTRQDSARDLSATLNLAPGAKELLGVGK